MNSAGYAVIVVLLVAAIGTYAVFPLGPSATIPGTNSTTSSTTQQTSCSSNTTTQITSTTTNGNYTVSGSGVRVDYVRALVYPDQAGQRTMRMEVGFTNVGTSNIYVPIGCGSSLNSTITSGAGVIRAIAGGARCLCAEALSPVSPGQRTSEIDPGCWSGYYYQVVTSGTFSARLVLWWYPSSGFSGLPSHVVINATFTIP